MSKNTNLDTDIFIVAGWIHDIGRKIDVEKHHIISLDFLDEFLESLAEQSIFNRFDFSLNLFVRF